MMTVQQEAEYINEVLPQMAQRPSSFGLRRDARWQGRTPDRQELFSLAHRLIDEKLATRYSENTTYMLVITSLGRQIAESPDGYLGHLAQQLAQQRLEERRAERSANGSWISGIAAAIGIIISLYSIYSASKDTDSLKQQVEAQDNRIKVLETQLQNHASHMPILDQDGINHSSKKGDSSSDSSISTGDNRLRNDGVQQAK